MLKINKASSKVVDDAEILEENHKGDGDNDNGDNKEPVKDPNELISELETKIVSLELDNSRLKKQNEVVIDALTDCKNKESVKKPVKNVETLRKLIAVIQTKLNELRQHIETNSF